MRSNMMKRFAAVMAGIIMLSGMPMQSINAEEIVEQKSNNQESYNNPTLSFETETKENNVETENEQLEENVSTQNDNEEVQKEPEQEVETKEEIKNVECVEERSSEFNYVFVNKPQLEENEIQSFIVSWGNEKTTVDNMELIVENELNEKVNVRVDKSSKNVYLFESVFEKGIYHIAGLKIINDKEEKEYSAEELDIQVYFGVGKEYKGDQKSDYIEVDSIEEGIPELDSNIVTISDNNEEKNSNIVKKALDKSEEIVSSRSIQTFSTEIDTKDEELVVVLDPGHDEKHAGAQKNGIKEEVASLKIATYCKEELEKYSGVTVYMTREGSACPFPNSKDNIDDIIKRTDWAKTKNADVFISFHLNDSNSSKANGAEVYYPKGNKDSQALAEKLLEGLEALGLNNRGAKESEGYAVVKHSVRNGFPGFIIEHAFVSNTSDAKWFKTDENLKKLGIADATGIAKHYKLEKSLIGLEGINFDKKSPQGLGTKINLTAKLKKPAEGMQYKYVWMKNNWKEWGILKDFSTESSVNWQPNENGTYYIYLNVKDKTGRVETVHAEYKITHGEWKFDGINPSCTDIKQGTAITIKPNVSGMIEGLQYKFVWMRDNWKEWGVLNNFSESNTCEFKPRKIGEYTLFVDVKDTDGKVITKSRTYKVAQSVWNFENIKTDLASPQEADVEKIQIIPNVTGEIKNLQYKYVWQKDNWKEWGIIKEFSSSSTVSWKPKKPGNYTLYVDLKDSQGKVVTKTIFYKIKKLNWNYKAIELTPLKEQGVEKSVEIKAITEGNAKNLQYKFVWMRDNWREWGVIQPFSKKNTVNWEIPKKDGIYRFYVDVKTSDGEVRTKWKEYCVTSSSWKLEGLNINHGEEGQPLVSIPITALVTGATSDLQYKFVWQKDNWKEWGIICDFQKLNYVTNWIPKMKGNYKIYVDVKDAKGRVETTHKEFVVK